MTLWLLFLRSRRAFPATVGLLLTIALGWLVGYRWATHADVIMLAAVIVPLAGATIISATAASLFGEVEQTVSRPLAPLRLSHLAGLLTVAAVGLFGAVLAWGDMPLGWQFARNLLGLAGIGLLTARFDGGRWPWAVPLGFSMLAMLQRGMTDGPLPRWAWVVQPASGTSSLIALGLLLAGLLLAGYWGVGGVDAEHVG